MVVVVVIRCSRRFDIYLPTDATWKLVVVLSGKNRRGDGSLSSDSSSGNMR